MKTVIGLFSLFAVVVNSVVSLASNSPDSSDVIELPVEVDVDCPGVDFSKLSLTAAGFSSKALQETYNKVHQDTDGGDSFLKKIHFDHAVKKTNKNRPKTVATAANAATGLRGSADTDKGEGELGWPWRKTRYYGSWQGDWGCRLCPYLLSSSGGIAVRAWETAFVEAILESDHNEFAKAKTCTISIGMAPHVIDFTEQEPELSDIEGPALKYKIKQEDDPVQMSVEVDAECDGVDYHNLPIEAIGFASKALQETYNKVHQDLDNGDSFLSKIHFDHAFKKKQPKVDADLEEDGELFGALRYWGSWMGDWGCRFCPDDLTAFDLLDTGGIAVHAWEAEFTATLAGSKHKEFAKAKDCHIDIFSKPVVANTAPLASV